MPNYQFTNSWFEIAAKQNWDNLIPQFIKPSKVLEVGSYEGASACYLIEKMANYDPLEIHCIDTWEGGIEHQAGGTIEANMQSVEARFNHNLSFAIDTYSKNCDLRIHKGNSDFCMSKLFSQGL